jgi:predicted HNH restriction endonuclease
MTNLRAHHIIPLGGDERVVSVFNIPWNLICLCHRCHLEIHALMRELAKPILKDMFELARERGQLVFNIP